MPILRDTLRTIGYAGFDIQKFLAVLDCHGIERLVDIREIPISRKFGFSKRSLSGALHGHGISYIHVPLLGSPKQLRHAVRETGDYRTFFAGVDRHLSHSECVAALRQVAATARESQACLMCYCPDWSFCHRKCVVRALEGMSRLKFEHLSLAGAGALARKAA